MKDVELIKVIDGGDFRDRWKGLCITLEAYENIDLSDYTQQLHFLFEYDSFVFDENIHEYWEID